MIRNELLQQTQQNSILDQKYHLAKFHNNKKKANNNITEKADVENKRGQKSAN